MPNAKIVTPKFITLSKAGEPTFVAVHAKIVRGAFARWLIKNKIDTSTDITQFTELHYRYNATLSTPEQPVFICKTFGGIGLSIRLS